MVGNSTGKIGMTLDQLRKALRKAEPNVILVPQRILRRVIKHDRRMTSLGLQVPHRKTYSLDFNEAVAILERDELGLDFDPDTALNGPVYLLAEPSPKLLEESTTGQILLQYWRFLFHARVDRTIDDARRSGQLNEVELRSRIDQIGHEIFDEARTVLKYEDYLLPPRDLHETYREFAAVYLEIRHFAPRLLRSCFPSIQDTATIDAIIGLDVDGNALFEATRPTDAPQPGLIDARIDWANRVGALEPEVAESKADAVGTSPLPTPYQARRLAEKLISRSGQPAQRGNLVRAAILRVRAERCADPLGPPLASKPRVQAAEALGLLGERLVNALGLEEAESDRWRHALPALLAPASEGIWAIEARLLFDLQKLCVDYERSIYTVDLIDWFSSLFRRPIKRILPFQQEVLAVKHLRSAHRRLRRARISEPDRQRLEHLIHRALRRAESILRERCRDPLAQTLQETGFEPRSIAEQVSFDKMVEELLDKIVSRGFLAMGDLRDAIARNHVKLPDLDGRREFFQGDRLLKANHALSTSLDGIYREGEVYLRWLQRFSSLGFGTPPGRFITKYLVLPFAGAFVVLFFVDHLFAMVTKQMGYGLDEAEHTSAVAASLTGDEPNAAVDQETDPDAVNSDLAEDIGDSAIEAAADSGESTLSVGDHGGGLHLIPEEVGPWIVVTFVAGVFLFGLIHLPEFRTQVLKLLRALYDVIKGLLIDVPHWILDRPEVRRLIETRGFQLLWRLMVKPMIPALLAYGTLLIMHVPTSNAQAISLFIFFAIAVVLNLRFGRDLEEISSDYVVNTWRVIRVNIIGDLYRTIVDLSRVFLEQVDRLLYTVDEWLRFRGGEGRFSFVSKAILGVFWSVVTYIVRFVVNLLVEPQVNPLKHFPVVTVSHKVMFPILVAIFVGNPPEQPSALYQALGAETVAPMFFFTQLLLPGVFGFLVWELKENWRLYDANRSKWLQRVLIGSHGESMPRLLKPGLHSGTQPKIFHRLRVADRKPRGSNARARIQRLHEEHHHLEEAIVQFVDRELMNLLIRSRSWSDAPGIVDEVETSTNRIQIAIRFPEIGDAPLRLIFEHAAGWVFSDIKTPDWYETLSDDRRRSLQAALAGFFQMAGVQFVRPQLESLLSPEVRSYHFEDERIVTWAGPQLLTEVSYDLNTDSKKIYPSVVGPKRDSSFPIILADDLLLARQPISWQHWVETWEAEQAGESPEEPYVPAFRVQIDREPTSIGTA